MSPSEILSGCSRDGVSLNLTNDGMIRYAGDEYAIKYWLPILAAYKTELVEELSFDPFAIEIKPVKRCQDCTHLARPGLSDGHCAQRQDLPPAYGINHPLRQLPPDNGESCDEYDPCYWIKP